MHLQDAYFGLEPVAGANSHQTGGHSPPQRQKISPKHIACRSLLGNSCNNHKNQRLALLGEAPFSFQPAADFFWRNLAQSTAILPGRRLPNSNERSR
jgi:hypothetical protein